MTKIFKPKRRVVKPRINEMAPYYSEKQPVDPGYISRTVKQIQDLYDSGSYEEVGAVRGLRNKLLLKTKKTITVAGYSCNSYFMVDEDRVVLLTAFHDVEDANIPYAPVTQALIWREPSATNFKGAIIDIIWEYLFKENHAIITDTAQSDSGRGVWRSMLREALLRNLEIFFIDYRKNSIIKPESEDKVWELFDSFYGEELEFFDKVIAICDPEYRIGV